jgi:Sulfotransferase domain
MTADRQFVSYPKSGRTWIRYVLHVLGLENQIFFHHDGCEFSDPSRPPLALDFIARLRKYSTGGRTVYMRRDPRDVMVSLYFQIKGRMRDVHDFNGEISSFIRDDYFGAANLYAFDKQWRELCDRGLALCVTYESCHESLYGVMRDVLEWYGLDVDDGELKIACRKASFQKMRAVEEGGKFSQPWLRPRNGATKTRRGIMGGYADYLSPADIAFLDHIFGSTNEKS